MPKQRANKQQKKQPNAVKKYKQPARFTNQEVQGYNTQSIKAPNATTDRIKGKVRLSDVTTPLTSNDSQGIDLDYLGLINTRLAAQFQTHEMWFVHSLTFHFIPMLAATAPGTIVMAPEYDPLDMSPSGANSADILMNYQRAKSSSVTRNFDVYMPNIKLPSGEWCRGMLYTDVLGDKRLNSYGKIMYTSEGTGLAAETQIGWIEMSYDISFSIPQLAMDVDIGSSSLNTIKAGTTGGIITPCAEYTTTADVGFNCHWRNNLGTITAQPLGSVITGLYKADTGILQTPNGESLTEGTRIYCQPATAAYESASNFNQAMNNYFVGLVSTNLVDIAGTALRFVGAAASQILLRNPLLIRRRLQS
jgi:hypothetical protein